MPRLLLRAVLGPRPPAEGGPAPECGPDRPGYTQERPRATHKKAEGPAFGGQTGQATHKNTEGPLKTRLAKSVQTLGPATATCTTRLVEGFKSRPLAGGFRPKVAVQPGRKSSLIKLMIPMMCSGSNRVVTASGGNFRRAARHVGGWWLGSDHTGTRVGLRPLVVKRY